MSKAPTTGKERADIGFWRWKKKLRNSWWYYLLDRFTYYLFYAPHACIFWFLAFVVVYQVSFFFFFNYLLALKGGPTFYVFFCIYTTISHRCLLEIICLLDNMFIRYKIWNYKLAGILPKKTMIVHETENFIGEIGKKPGLRGQLPLLRQLALNPN